MIEIYKQLTLHQFEAALCMLGICVDRCPDENSISQGPKCMFTTSVTFNITLPS